MTRWFLIAAAAVALAVSVWLALGGARLGAPSAFLVVAALCLVTVIYLLARSGAALVRDLGDDEVRVATGRRRKELEREKQSLLKALKELEFDHEMGKISDSDYADIAGRYRGRTIAVMRQLDDAGADYKKLVERDLAERIAQRAGEKVAGDNKASGEKSAAAKPAGARNMKPARIACPGCETPNDPDAVFCKRCGRQLGAADQAT